MKIINEAEFVFGYEGVAAYCGVSVSTLKRILKREGYGLCKWGEGKTSCVYVSLYIAPHIRNLIQKNRKRYEK